MANDATLSVSSIVTLAFSTGLVTACANQAIAHVRERYTETKKSGEKAREIAIQLAANLTDFAIECANFNSLHQYTKNNGGGVSDQLPLLRQPGEHSEWTYFPPAFTARFHDLKSSLKQGQENVEFTEFDEDPPAAAEYAARMSVELGHQAHLLARRVGASTAWGDTDTLAVLIRLRRLRRHTRRKTAGSDESG